MTKAREDPDWGESKGQQLEFLQGEVTQRFKRNMGEDQMRLNTYICTTATHQDMLRISGDHKKLERSNGLFFKTCLKQQRLFTL